jgi:hypothetical protein
MGRKDGNIVRGIQGGASSFTYSATSAALDVTQRLAGLVQV